MTLYLLSPHQNFRKIEIPKSADGHHTFLGRSGSTHEPHQRTTEEITWAGSKRVDGPGRLCYYIVNMKVEQMIPKKVGNRKKLTKVGDGVKVPELSKTGRKIVESCLKPGKQ